MCAGKFNVILISTKYLLNLLIYLNYLKEHLKEDVIHARVNFLQIITKF